MAKARAGKKAAQKKSMPSKAKKAPPKRKPAPKKAVKPKTLPPPHPPIKPAVAPSSQPISPSLPPPPPQLPQAAPPEPETAGPVGAPESHTPVPGGVLSPALDLLPMWEDRERLRRFMSEEGLSFSAPEKGSSDFSSASRFLSASGKKADAAQQGYVIISCADRGGKPVAAMDGYLIGNVLVLMRARVTVQANKRALHILLYAAALARAKPSYVVLAEPRAFSFEAACRLIFMGRGLGMSAIPLSHKSLLFLIRRVGRESDPIADGKEIAGALKPLVALFSGLETPIGEIERKDMVALVPLPNSPDTREHLHELKDAVLALGLPAESLDKVLQRLAEDYVLDRKDISPESF